jgi:uncharacterized OB-fold protein
MMTDKYAEDADTIQRPPEPWYVDHLAGLARGEFLLQRCDACGRHSYPPSVRCPECFALGKEMVPASGAATVIGSTVVRSVVPTTVPRLPFGMCLVRLDEGPQVLARCLPAGHSVQPGSKVQLRVEPLDGLPGLPVVRVDEN